MLIINIMRPYFFISITTKVKRWHADFKKAHISTNDSRWPDHPNFTVALEN